MAGGYPCCCEDETSSPGRACGCCPTTPDTWTVTFTDTFVNNTGCMGGDCEDLNGVYVLDRLGVFPPDGASVCNWRLSFASVCGYDTINLRTYCGLNSDGSVDTEDVQAIYVTVYGSAGDVPSIAFGFLEAAYDLTCGGCYESITGALFSTGGPCDVVNFTMPNGTLTISADGAACGSGCCGTDVPVDGVSTCVATITGVGGCAGNPLHPTNGDHSLTYRGTAAYNPCGGSNFPAGPMKWVADVGTYVLVATCQSDHIDLVFYFYTCGGGGSLSSEIIWYASVALGSCNFEGDVLTLNADLFGCADPGSTVTLHDFVL